MDDRARKIVVQHDSSPTNEPKVIIQKENGDKHLEECR